MRHVIFGICALVLEIQASAITTPKMICMICPYLWLL